eukprot:6012638-Pleurochrysis_carterae.AAC.1
MVLLPSVAATDAAALRPAGRGGWLAACADAETGALLEPLAQAVLVLEAEWCEADQEQGEGEEMDDRGADGRDEVGSGQDATVRLGAVLSGGWRRSGKSGRASDVGGSSVGEQAAAKGVWRLRSATLRVVDPAVAAAAALTKSEQAKPRRAQARKGGGAWEARVPSRMTFAHASFLERREGASPAMCTEWLPRFRPCATRTARLHVVAGDDLQS